VAAAPGQPTHVLESDQEAEHIPGCNMAFRREELLAINGFDPQFRRAGDDVDVCWRLRQAGRWITFAPGAVVWHHRRQTPRTYLRQQAGYGEAEALLRFKHPDKFNGRGDGKWRGVMYGAAAWGLRFSEAVIYRGTFGTGLFQCVYQPGPAHWAMLPSTLEWHAVAALLALAALVWPALGYAAAAMLVLSLAVAGLQALQAPLSRRYGGAAARLVVAALCYAQPLVRSGARYRTRLLTPRSFPPPAHGTRRLSLAGGHLAGYWTETWCERTELLRRVVAYLDEHRWGKVLDSGWSAWDLEIDCHRWTVVQVATAQEDYGGGRRLIRARFRLRPGGPLKLLGLAAGLALAAAAATGHWVNAGAATGLLAAGAAFWLHGVWRGGRAVAVFDAQARGLGLARCPPHVWRDGIAALARPPADDRRPAA
jgi:hypothetical protein